MVRERITLGWRTTAAERAPAVAESEEFVEVIDEAAVAVAVKAIQIQPLSVDPWSPPDPLDVCLECWKIWMSRNDRDLGTQQQKLRTGDDEDDDEDQRQKDSESVAAAAAQRRDNEIAEATDAAINGLRACDRWAIYKMMGLASAWKFPLLDFMETAQKAKVQVERRLRENIATRALFG